MKTAEQILDEHCTTVYNKYNGDEEIESSKSAVVIAMEEFAKEYHTEQLRIAVVVQAKPEKVCKGSMRLGTGCGKCKKCKRELQSM